MKSRKTGIWCVFICLSQVLMALIERACYQQCADLSAPFNPLTHLYGGERGAYDMPFYGVETEMWATTLTLYCVMVVRQLAQCQEENSYMAIARYESFHKYYKMVYVTFLQLTVCYQIAVWVGSCAGVVLVEALGTPVEKSFFEIFLIQLCLLAGNLFFGSIMLYLIIHKNEMRLAIILYPGFPIVCLIAKKLPMGICNLLPGSWLMFGRSEVAALGGFSLGTVLLLELLLFVGMSFLFFRKRLE